MGETHARTQTHAQAHAHAHTCARTQTQRERERLFHYEILFPKGRKRLNSISKVITQPIIKSLKRNSY